MKRIFLLCFCSLGIICHSQEIDTINKQPTVEVQKIYLDSTPEVLALKSAEKLSGFLNLDPIQKLEVQTYYYGKIKARQHRAKIKKHATEWTKQDMLDEQNFTREERMEIDAEMKGLLSEEQYLKWKNYIELNVDMDVIGIPMEENSITVARVSEVAGVAKVVEEAAAAVVVESKPDTYTVVKGDTLYSISKRFNIPMDILKQYNGLTGDGIAIGQLLYLQQRKN